MINRKITYILLLCLAATGIISISFAQEDAIDEKRPQSSLSADSISKNMPAFTFNLQKYVNEAEKNIKKIDYKMLKEGILGPGGEGERNAMISAEMGDLAYKNGKLQDAIDQWHQAYISTKMPQLKKSLKKAEDRAKAELGGERQAEERILRKDEESIEANSEPSMSKVEEYICSIGVVYYERGEYVDARKEFEKALIINPGNKIAKNYLNRIAVAQKYSSTSVDQPVKK